MYAVNTEKLQRWLSIKNRAYRFWVRAWIDSLHVGTHIHWQLSPFSVLGLAFMWRFIARQESHYTKRQRTAIKAMARRRQKDPGFLSQMPRFQDDDSQWESFFSEQISAKEQIQKELVRWHVTTLKDCTDMAVLHSNMASLYSSLLLKGFATDQLLYVVCKGVLDPLSQADPEENLIALFNSFANPPATEFLAYTKLEPIGATPISKRLLHKWSKSELPSLESFHPEESQPRTQAVLIGDSQVLEPFIVTRGAAIGGIGELHRREAQYVYSLRLAQHPGLSIFILPSRSHFRLAAPVSEENYYDVNFKRTELSLPVSVDNLGAVLFQKATRDLFDAPEDALRNLLVGTELRWRGQSIRTDRVLADAYRWRLRSRLTTDFANYLARVRSMIEKAGSAPSNVLGEISAWEWQAEKDLSLLESRLARLPNADDELVLYRLRELTNWYASKPESTSELTHRANTFREIDDLMALARGIRNSATHYEAADQTTYGISLYLAKVFFEAFVSACIRDSTKLAEGRSAAAA